MEETKFLTPEASSTTFHHTQAHPLDAISEVNKNDIKNIEMINNCKRTTRKEQIDFVDPNDTSSSWLWKHNLIISKVRKKPYLSPQHDATSSSNHNHNSSTIRLA